MQDKNKNSANKCMRCENTFQYFNTLVVKSKIQIIQSESYVPKSRGNKNKLVQCKHRVVFHKRWTVSC